MLATFCLTFCVWGVEPFPDVPVSAESAIHRARFAEARERYRARLKQAAEEKSPRVDTAYQALLTTPMAQVNQATLTVADATLKCRSAVMRELSRHRPEDALEAIVQSHVIARLPLAIEQEVLWQAAQRDLPPDQFQRAVEYLELAFDNHRLWRLAHDSQPYVDPYAALVEIYPTGDEELRREYVRESLTREYLHWAANRHAAIDARPVTDHVLEIVRTERERAIIQVGYELPPYEDPRNK